jgi:hypothetical protein
MLNTVTYKAKSCYHLYPSGTAPTLPCQSSWLQGTYIAGQAVEMSATPGTIRRLLQTLTLLLMLEYDVVVDARLGTSWVHRHLMKLVWAIPTPVLMHPVVPLASKTADLSKVNAGTDYYGCHRNCP